MRPARAALPGVLLAGQRHGQRVGHGRRSSAGLLGIARTPGVQSPAPPQRRGERIVGSAVRPPPWAWAAVAEIVEEVQSWPTARSALGPALHHLAFVREEQRRKRHVVVQLRRQRSARQLRRLLPVQVVVDRVHSYSRLRAISRTDSFSSNLCLNNSLSLRMDSLSARRLVQHRQRSRGSPVPLPTSRVCSTCLGIGVPHGPVHAGAARGRAEGSARGPPLQLQRVAGVPVPDGGAERRTRISVEEEGHYA